MTQKSFENTLSSPKTELLTYEQDIVANYMEESYMCTSIFFYLVDDERSHRSVIIESISRNTLTNNMALLIHEVENWMFSIIP